MASQKYDFFALGFEPKTSRITYRDMIQLAMKMIIIYCITIVIFIYFYC